MNAAGAGDLRAIRYLEAVGFDSVHRQELALTTMALGGASADSACEGSGIGEGPEEHCGI